MQCTLNLKHIFRNQNYDLITVLVLVLVLVTVTVIVLVLSICLSVCLSSYYYYYKILDQVKPVSMKLTWGDRVVRNDQLGKIAKIDCLKFKTVRLARQETRRIGFRLVQQSAAGITITAEQLEENTNAGVASRLPASGHVNVIYHNCNNTRMV